MPHEYLMDHDSKKNIFYHNFYLFFPICKRKEFKLFQLLESFKKNVLMHHPSIKKSVSEQKRGKDLIVFSFFKEKNGNKII